jgi:cytoskeletal protein CcmA (bactofilin family)
MQDTDNPQKTDADSQNENQPRVEPVTHIDEPNAEYKSAFELTEADLEKVKIAPIVETSVKLPIEPARANVSFIGENVSFKGAAALNDSCLVLGEVAGDLISNPNRVNAVSVSVEVGGIVVGTVCAGDVIIAGQIDGLIDAPGGSVDLKDTANVSGKVRYGKLQVSGAELNAKLERVVTAVVGQ